MQKIMFNDRYGLTQAVIEGRKTMTRRIMSGYPMSPSDRIEEASYSAASIGVIANRGETLFELKPRYKVGEVVAVAQSYEQVYLQGGMSGDDAIILGLKYDPGMSNKMYVRSNLMPHHICITNIRCERLQDISNEDCLREGIFVNEYVGSGEKCHHYGFDGFLNGREGWFAKGWYDTPREAFAALIDKVSGRGTWERNPWVVVYEFELVK